MDFKNFLVNFCYDHFTMFFSYLIHRGSDDLAVTTWLVLNYCAPVAIMFKKQESSPDRLGS